MSGLSPNSFVIYAEVIKPKPEGVHSVCQFLCRLRVAAREVE